jgi:peptide-methionine (S)-S-oxide reductase
VHDPTQVNRQGPDVGTQYRSAVFYTGQEQRAATLQYIAWLQRSGAVKGKIVTEVAPLQDFYTAAPYHQDYTTLHPYEAYVRYNDLPKIAALKQHYPQLWSEQRAAY